MPRNNGDWAAFHSVIIRFPAQPENDQKRVGRAVIAGWHDGQRVTHGFRRRRSRTAFGHREAGGAPLGKAILQAADVEPFGAQSGHGFI